MNIPRMNTCSDDRSADKKASLAVIKAVANEEGIDSRALTDPLFEAIDPGALDAICHNSSVRVSFEYHGYLVTVDGENNVNLSDTV